MPRLTPDEIKEIRKGVFTLPDMLYDIMMTQREILKELKRKSNTPPRRKVRKTKDI